MPGMIIGLSLEYRENDILKKVLNPIFVKDTKKSFPDLEAFFYLQQIYYK
jgi:hypothetical protein